MILQKSEIPPILAAYPQVKGVFVDGCVDGWDTPPDTLGHSHSKKNSIFPLRLLRHEPKTSYGWICFKNRIVLQDDQLMRHELAHILTGHGHDDVWRAKVLELGGHLEEYEFHRDGIAYGVPCFRKECMEDPLWRFDPKARATLRPLWDMINRIQQNESWSQHQQRVLEEESVREIPIMGCSRP